MSINTEFHRIISFSLKPLRGDSVVSASQVRQNFIHLTHRYKTDKVLIVQIDKGMPNGAAEPLFH